MNMWKPLLAGALVAILLPVLSGKSDESKQRDEMLLKLDYTKEIVGGLVTEDFDKILKGADSLNRLGKRKWVANETAAYRTQNQVFWFTTGSLVYAAENENIDGATLAYTQMMHSCVNCHKLIRRQ